MHILDSKTSFALHCITILYTTRESSPVAAIRKRSNIKTSLRFQKLATEGGGGGGMLLDYFFTI